MPATAAVISAGASRQRPGRILAKVFLWLWLLGFFLIIAFRGPVLLQAWAQHWPELLFWLALVLIVDLFPVEVGERLLTLDLPLLLAVAFLYPPEAAASVALVGALDRRELAGEVALPRALLNRLQTAASVLAAGHVFHALGGASGLWWRSLAGVALAVAVDYLVNVILVSSIIVLRMPGDPGRAFRRVLSGLRVGSSHQFLLSYLGYGMLAFALSRLFVDPGPWSVVMLLTPIVVARQALLKTQELERTTRDLRTQQRLLSRVLDQIVEERRDERRLVAGELHDEVLQQVTRTQLAALAMAERGPADADRGPVQDLVRASGTAMRALRQVIHGLRGSPLGGGGLVPALRQLLVMLESEWGREIRSRIPSAVSLGPEAQLAAYQGAREGLVNALKHSGASRIALELEEVDATARLVVRDDGKGFTTEPEGGTHFGLDLLRERVHAARGHMSVKSGRGNGTRLELLLPLEPRSSSAGR